MRRENSIGFTYGGIGRTEYAAGDKAERGKAVAVTSVRLGGQELQKIAPHLRFWNLNLTKPPH